MKTTTLILMMTFGLFAIQVSYAQIPTTQLRSIDCGKTNLTPTAQIQCDPVA